MSAASSASASRLYSPRLLALSASLAAFPLDDRFAHVTETHSRTCGSSIKLGLDLDDDGLIERLGLQVSACAVGQSSAAIMAKGIVGSGFSAVDATSGSIKAWLNGDGSLPEFPEMEALESAWPHKGRHETLLLPWKAAREALSLFATNR